MTLEEQHETLLDKVEIVRMAYRGHMSMRRKHARVKTHPEVEHSARVLGVAMRQLNAFLIDIGEIESVGRYRRNKRTIRTSS